MSTDFVFGLPKDSEGNTDIVVFVDRLSTMAHLAAVSDSIDAEGTAKLFIDRLGGGEVADRLADISPATVQKQVG
uniref:RxLR effector candidate protein n=1 Tax=Hyaloperonospora arabidopsidis (strain Emoy2) TaxID=559515 RepID=M4BM90_HYAAE